MSAKISRIFSRTMLILAIISVVYANARPSHFGETNQVSSDQDNNNLLDSGVKQWQLERLAQRLSEINNNINNNPLDYGWESGIQSPETKRQSRYRQCYFHPISCFRK